MSVKDRDVLRTFLSQNDQRQNPTLSERRARLDMLDQFFAVLEGVEVEPGKVGSIPGEWVCSWRARHDAVRLASRAEEVGVEVSFETWGGMGHVSHAFHPILSEGRDAIARIGAFISGHVE